MIVSFIIVACNAGAKLEKLMQDLDKQDYDHGKIEVILVDSNSSDYTKTIMNNFQKTGMGFLRVIVLDNPNKILSCGWNVALGASKGDVILRVDAHSSIPTNFISKNVETIMSGEKIVGGHRVSIIDETNIWQKILLKVENSLFGSGVALYRRTTEKRYVDTLAHAAYSKEVFDRVGTYDERLGRTEDNEMHYRMKEAGYEFLLNPEIISYHHARNSLGKMVKQKFLNGYWIGLTMGVCPKCFSIYHFVPFFFVIAIILTIIVSILGIKAPLILLIISYSIVNLFNSILAITKEKLQKEYFVLPVLFFLLHISYGGGTLIGLIKMPRWVKANRKYEIKSV